MSTSLQQFLRKYGTNTTTNFDLMRMAKELKIPHFHVCMRDEVSRSALKAPYNAIVNLHTSDEKGAHWSCFTDNYFFDSYGLPPTEEVKNLMKHGEYNTFQLQIPSTKLCGQLCIFVLYQLNQGIPFLDILLHIKSHISP